MTSHHATPGFYCICKKFVYVFRISGQRSHCIVATIKPQPLEGDPTRLYSLDELAVILRERGMRIVRSFSDYKGREASDKELQLLVYSVKE